MVDRESCQGILIVEDDSDIRDALTLILQNEGYNVYSAVHGKEALELLRKNRNVCLILLDLMLPVMNGWQFRAEQLQDPELASVPVVLISADSGLEKKAVSFEAAGFLKKPIQLDDLLETVGRHC